MGNMKSALERAIAAAGSTYKLAALLNCGQSRVSMWVTRGQVPAEHVLAVEAVTGISRHDLRPDVFGPAPERAAA